MEFPKLKRRGVGVTAAEDVLEEEIDEEFMEEVSAGRLLDGVASGTELK